MAYYPFYFHLYPQFLYRYAFILLILLIFRLYRHQSCGIVKYRWDLFIWHFYLPYSQLHICITYTILKQSYKYLYYSCKYLIPELIIFRNRPYSVIIIFLETSQLKNRGRPTRGCPFILPSSHRQTEIFLKKISFPTYKKFLKKKTHR